MNAVAALVDLLLLDHSNVRMTLPYVHSTDREIEAAAERVGAVIARVMALEQVANAATLRTPPHRAPPVPGHDDFRASST